MSPFARVGVRVRVASMARVLAVSEQDVSQTLRSALLQQLRVYDEVRILPAAYRSPESSAFKNVTIRLSGTESGLSGDLFSPNWFMGVSVLEVPSEIAQPLLEDPKKRATALDKLAKAIPSELADASVEVGPGLDGDDNDRDTKPWEAGFDSPGCCVGLYSAQQTKAPGDTAVTGMDRVHHTYYLVAKAGGGIAAQTFHARLCAALTQGKSLDEALESGDEPGPQALRRVAMAAQRNRGRILIAAARAIGFHTLDTLSDQASPDGQMYRQAVTPVNSVINVLRKIEVNSSGQSLWQYSSGCVDAQFSSGVVTATNAQQGFVLFTTQSGDLRVPQVKNGLYDSVPFASERTQSNRDVVMMAAAEHKKAKAASVAAHPDSEWIRERFAWRSKALGLDLEPPVLWGAFREESWIGSWGREVGVAGLRAVTLTPEVVAISAVEAPKLRAAAKFVNG